jgi:hypothetical protein
MSLTSHNHVVDHWTTGWDICIKGPTIINSFWFNVNQTTLLGMVVGAGVVIDTSLASLFAKYTNRTLSAIFVMFVSCIGVISTLAVPPIAVLDTSDMFLRCNISCFKRLLYKLNRLMLWVL